MLWFHAIMAVIVVEVQRLRSRLWVM